MAHAVTVSHVTKTFSDGTQALHDVSFFADDGDFIIVAGSNGSGKSVLMSIIASLEEPTSGSVACTGKAGLVFQDADAQILGETVAEDTAFGPRSMGLRKQALAECVDTALARCGLRCKKDAPARQLSGGEKRRLAVAGVLALNADIILFDEPFANLDWPGIQDVRGILSDLKRDGKTIIVLTHELEKVFDLANRFIILDCGSIRFDGKPAEALTLNLEQWSIHHPGQPYYVSGTEHE